MSWFLRIYFYHCLSFQFFENLLSEYFIMSNLPILSRFKHILQPIADVCIAKEQQKLVDFDSFFTHTICHECCHGIGPHTIVLPNGQKSTVRLVSDMSVLFNVLLAIIYLSQNFFFFFFFYIRCSFS